MTPTDQIPFTRGMAATIADTFDALAKHVAATDVRKQAGLVPTPQPAPHPKPYTEATRWNLPSSNPDRCPWRIRDGVVEIQLDDGFWIESVYTVESLLSAEQRGEVVRVGEEVPEAHSGGYRQGFAAGLAKAEATIASLQSQLAAEREAVKVLVQYIHASEHADSHPSQDDALSEFECATNNVNACPIARAAVEAARKEPAR